MKKFRFTLQALWTVRERQEQIAREHYTQAVRARQLAVDTLASVQRECESTWQLHRNRIATGAPAAHLQQVQEYITALNELKTRHERALREAVRIAEVKWNQLKLASQAREAVDKLQLRQRKRHDEAMERDEQKHVDDLAQRRLSVVAGLSVKQG